MSVTGGNVRPGGRSRVLYDEPLPRPRRLESMLVALDAAVVDPTVIVPGSRGEQVYEIARSAFRHSTVGEVLE